jgi:hypothetical protein
LSDATVGLSFRVFASAVCVAPFFWSMLVNALSPVVWLAVPAIVVAFLGFYLLRRRREPSYRFAQRPARIGLIRGLFGTVFLLAAVVLVLGALSVYQYVQLSADRPVARVDVAADGPQRFRVSLTTPDGRTQDFMIDGDQWQLEARVIRWRVPVALAGIPPLYRLDRLTGRYTDIEKQRTATRSVYALDGWTVPDLWSLQRQFPQWLPFVDADYGSATFLPMLDGGVYQVSINPRGGLVATPADDATKQRLQRTGW